MNTTTTMSRGCASAVMGAMLCCAGATRAQDAKASAVPPTFEQAQKLASRGRLDQAMTMLNALAKQTPEAAGVERLRGMILYQRDDLDGAIAAFTKAEAQDANDRTSIEMHGVSLFREGHVAEAIPFLEKARTAVEGANVDPEYVLALCYADVGRYDDARRAFARQFGFDPESAEAHLLAGRMFLRRELRDQAGAEATKALALRAQIPLAHELLGEVALAKGDTPGAIAELEAERKVNPMNAALYDRLGDAYLRNADLKQAQNALNRAVLLEPNATGPYILLGQTFLKLQQPAQALHYLARAAQMDPKNFVTHNLLGQAYKAMGRVDDANREFRTVVDLQHPESAPAAEK